MPSDLEDLRERLTLWESLFSGSDSNSIVHQALRMLWGAAVFRMVNEARKIAEEEKRPLNGTLHQAINQDFFSTQLQAIRRLTEGGPIHGDKGVCSLRALILDMQTCASWMTRQNFFAIERLECDIDIIERRRAEFIQTQGSRIFTVPPELWRPKVLHKTFDQLSLVEPRDRKPTDVVSPRIFQALLSKLDIAWPGDFEEYVHKFVAHAATPASRMTMAPDCVLPTLGALWDAHAAICRTANFIGEFFLKGGGVSLPYPQFNQFENIEQPLVAAENVQRLSDKWDEHEKEVSGYRAWEIADLIPE